MPTLRSYQVEDVAAVIEAHKTHQCVLGRAPTGSGKAVSLAAIASHYMKLGKVLCLVDMSKLVKQLAKTFSWWTGENVVIEQGTSKAADQWFNDPRLIVGTVQTQYSGGKGKERYRKTPPTDLSALLLDETELFLAPRAMEVVKYYMEGNPALRVFGCSATPMRTDGVAMAELFDHLAFDRDIKWGVDEGWLVKPRQGFIRVSVDFSTLKVRKNEDGDKDYSDADIAKMVNNEQTLIELAKGIVFAAEDRRSIVACPDVASAQAVTHYLEAERRGCARVVYGEMQDEEKERTMAAHQAGEFQFLVSVMLLTKGYDDPGCVCVFNCRKTRSRRLYAQLMGRCTRPTEELAHRLGDMPTAEERIAAIAASEKASAVMFNMVGIEREVRDITVLDILGERHGEAAVSRAKEKLLQSEIDEFDAEAAINRAEEDIEAERLIAMEEAAKRRQRIEVQAKVEIDYDSDGGGSLPEQSHLPARHVQIFRQNRLHEDEISRLTPEVAKKLVQKIMYRHKAHLCTYRQAKLLQRMGYAKSELEPMTRDLASYEIERCKAAGWKRPPVEPGEMRLAI